MKSYRGKKLSMAIATMASVVLPVGFSSLGASATVVPTSSSASTSSTSQVSSVGRFQLAQSSVSPSQLPDGYWMVAADGGVFAFGGAQFYGSTGNMTLNKPIVGMASTPDGGGYWLVASDGGIFSFGDAQFYGSTGNISLNKPIVGMASTPDGGGYWLVASDGGVFSFGDAGYYGSLGSMPIGQSVVGIAPTPDGGGYWIATSNGAVFNYGDAKFGGSMGGKSLVSPVVGIHASADGRGYYLVAADGGIFSYGDSQFFGSIGGHVLNKPVVGFGIDKGADGYWEFASDGGVFSYGGAQFHGSLGALTLNQPIVGGSIVGQNPNIALPGPGLTPPAARPVSIFYYPWWGTVPPDLTYEHWNQNGHNPPANDVASDFFPLGGIYSESDQATLNRQMQQISSAGITQINSSWWGQGSIEDGRLSLVVPTARSYGLNVAIHLEDYNGRTPASVQSDINYLKSTYNITTFYIWNSQQFSAAQWAPYLKGLSGVTIYATGDPGQMETGQFEQFAVASGFNGIYTYEVYDEQGSNFAPTCNQAHNYGLLCSASVGPGFVDDRANNDGRVRSRQNGQVYDSMWEGAVNSSADEVSITSYNEWHEGTQIEPAQDLCIPGYCYQNYDGAWGQSGTAASYAYLNRTAQWTALWRNGL